MAGGQRHLMKHRRIVSDTSALHLPLSMMHQRLPQSGTVMPQMTVSQLNDSLLQYVLALVIVLTRNTFCGMRYLSHCHIFN